MSYIGRGIDQIDNISTLDNLSFSGSTATYNLTQNSVAFVPVSADALQIQIDGVIQSGNYTVSGSTVTFDFTPSGSSVCNGIRHFGVGLLSQPSDGSVTTAKLGADSVTNTKVASSVITSQTAITSLADTDKFLVSDASDSGNLKYVEKQYLGGGTLEQVGTAFFESTQNSDTITLSNCFSNDYDHYVLYFYLLPDSNNVNIHMDVTSTGGSNYQSKFMHCSRFDDSNGDEGSNNGEDQSSVTLGTASDNARDGGLQGVLHFHTNNNHSSLSNSGSFHCQGYYKSLRFNNNQSVRIYRHGSYFRDTGNNAVPATLSFNPGSGNWSQANLKMFGVKGSNS